MDYPVTDTADFPRLHFEYGFDEREAFEAHSRGFRSHVTVEFENGDRFPVFFYDPITLAQDVEREASRGIPCVAEPGMIVIPEITLENMRSAVARVIAEGFFDHVRPVPKPESRS